MHNDIEREIQKKKKSKRNHQRKYKNEICIKSNG